MTAVTRWSMTVQAAGTTEKLTGELVAPNYFSLLGLLPAAGRLLSGSESRAAGTDMVVVVSHRYWTQRFGSDQAAVGRPMQIGNAVFTIVGVVAAGFDGLEVDETPPSFWIPVTTYAETVPALRGSPLLDNWGNRSFSCYARLAPKVSLASAGEELHVLDDRLRRDHPERTRIWADPVFATESVSVVFPAVKTRLSPSQWEQVDRFLTWLGVAFGLILLVACFNLANLILARTATRFRELAVRLALGAGGGRVLRQLLTENLLLSLAGALAGLFLARWTMSLLLGLGGIVGRPLAVETQVDGRVLLFAILAALVSALLVTVLPVLLVRRSNLSAAVRGVGGLWGGAHGAFRSC